MRLIKLFIVLSIVSAVFGCSKDSNNSASVVNEKNTLFEGKALQTIVDESFDLTLKDCDTDYVTMTAGADGDHIYINEHKDPKYALFLDTIMSKGKIKLTFKFSEVLSPVGVSTTREITAPFSIIGTYEVNNKDGVGTVFVDDVEVGTFTYGGTYNSYISLSFDYNSKILTHFPDVPEMKDTDFLDIFDDREFWVKSMNNVTSANFKALCDNDKIFE